MIPNRITKRELDSEGKVVLSGSLSDEDKEWIWGIENELDERNVLFMPFTPGTFVYLPVDDEYRIIPGGLARNDVASRVRYARVYGYGICLDWCLFVFLDFGIWEGDRPEIHKYKYDDLNGNWIGIEKSDLDSILKRQTDQTAHLDQ